MKHLAIAVILAVATACGPVEDERFDGYVSEIVSVDELLKKSDGPVTLDLRQFGIGYKLRNETDLSRLTLVCPNGQAMRMQVWLADRSAELGISFQQFETGFVIMPAKVTQAQSEGTRGAMVLEDRIKCPDGCYPCTDGSCVCGDEPP